MPPWLAAGMLFGTVAVVCVIYNYWRTEDCNTRDCGYHNHQTRPSNRSNDRQNNRPGPSNRNGDWQERYDTPPDFRCRQTTDDECPICLEHLLNAPQHTLKCRHRLHAECFRKLRSQCNFCPLCRKQL